MAGKQLATGGRDRISSLPDELLCHILSFVPTKLAASTLVLSTRWRNLNLFASAPNLDFDDSLFLYPEEGKRERDGVLGSFMNFVDRVLSSQGNSHIDRFSLKCGNGIDAARVNGWICDVLGRDIRELYLSVSLEDYLLPSDIFMCKALVNLRLGRGLDLNVPLDVCFPSLKALQLDSVRFRDEGDALRMLLSSCTVLEELVIDGLVWEHWNGFCYISVPTLKRLTIHYKGLSDFNAHVVSFNTPNLVYLEYSDLPADEYPDVNLDSLVEAHLDLQLTEEQIDDARCGRSGLGDDDRLLRVPGDATELIYELSNIQSLYLSPNAVEVLSVCCTVLPVFDNLTYLFIETDKSRGWQGLPNLLRNCPKLETLAFKGLLHCVTNGCGNVCSCKPRFFGTTCLLYCRVKTVEIWAFEGSEKELKTVKHLLVNLRFLEKMVIHACLDNEQLLEITKKLLMLPRASPKCRIELL